MSSTSQTHLEEHTFRQYTPDQAKAYADLRHSYHDNLYKIIFHHHASTGGSFGTLMDVGCGPGNVTRPLAKRFNTVYGVDPSPEMINTAKDLSAGSHEAETASGKKIEFIVGRAEELGKLIPDAESKVDLLTAATAAHWFDMPGFWSSAAQVVKKGGMVALWAGSSVYPHPSTPNLARVKELFLRLERQYLVPYETRGNRIARNAYVNLPLPWNVNPRVEGFSPEGFKRLDWDLEGHLSDGRHFFLGDRPVTLVQLEKQLGTASQVTRWRDEHPQLAGTSEDIVVKMVQEVRKELGGEELIIGNSCTLLLFKKD